MLRARANLFVLSIIRAANSPTIQATDRDSPTTSTDHALPFITETIDWQDNILVPAAVSALFQPKRYKKQPPRLSFW